MNKAQLIKLACTGAYDVIKLLRPDSSSKFHASLLLLAYGAIDLFTKKITTNRYK